MCTDRCSTTSIELERVDSGPVRTSFRHQVADGRPVLRAILMERSARGAKVSLVPDGALLLRGDSLHVNVCVDDGLQLTIVEPAGTVAYAMDGGSAQIQVDIDLGAASSLTWRMEPLVVAAGSQTRRSTTVRMAPESSLLTSDLVVLGRTNEMPGALVQELQIRDGDDRPMLVETLKLDERTPKHVVGNAHVVGSLLSMGPSRSLPTVEGRPWTRLELEGGELLRYLGTTAAEFQSMVEWPA